MYRWVLWRYGAAFVIRLIPTLLRPADLKRIWETIRYARRGTSRPEHLPSSDDVQAELLAIAVDGAQRGRGVGKELVASLEAWLVANSVRQYKVVTVASDPVSNGFYTDCGFVKTRSFVHHGNEMNEYVKILSAY